MPQGEDSRRANAVLVVDDDDDVRAAVADLVEDSGRQAFTARDGGEALRKLDTDSIPRPCLVLLDWIMNPMSGEEFLTQLNTRRCRPAPRAGHVGEYDRRCREPSFLASSVRSRSRSRPRSYFGPWTSTAEARVADAAAADRVVRPHEALKRRFAQLG